MIKIYYDVNHTKSPATTMTRMMIRMNKARRIISRNSNIRGCGAWKSKCGSKGEESVHTIHTHVFVYIYTNALEGRKYFTS